MLWDTKIKYWDLIGAPKNVVYSYSYNWKRERLIEYVLLSRLGTGSLIYCRSPCIKNSQFSFSISLFVLEMKKLSDFPLIIPPWCAIVSNENNMRTFCGNSQNMETLISPADTKPNINQFLIQWGGGVIFILHIKIYLLGRTLDSLNPVGHTHMST